VLFPPIAERFERLEETREIAHQMWKGDETPYQGKHSQLARLLNSPSSVQKPHPPILIGGAGERKTLRLVAQYGDACNFSLTSLGIDEAQHKLGVLREHCQSISRPYRDIEKTIIKRIHLTKDGREESWTPATAIAYFRQLVAMGIDQAIVSLPNVETIPERGQTERLVEKSLSCCRQNRKMLLFQQASSLPRSGMVS